MPDPRYGKGIPQASEQGLRIFSNLLNIHTRFQPQCTGKLVGYQASLSKGSVNPWSRIKETRQETVSPKVCLTKVLQNREG